MAPKSKTVIGKAYQVYEVLSDLDLNDVVYVGQTTQPDTVGSSLATISKRLPNALAEWAEEVKEMGETPIIRVVFITQDYDEAAQHKEQRIAELKARGVELLNA
jgi:hypothetical protein